MPSTKSPPFLTAAAVLPPVFTLGDEPSEPLPAGAVALPVEPDVELLLLHAASAVASTHMPAGAVVRNLLELLMGPYSCRRSGQVARSSRGVVRPHRQVRRCAFVRRDDCLPAPPAV